MSIQVILDRIRQLNDKEITNLNPIKLNNEYQEYAEIINQLTEKIVFHKIEEKRYQNRFSEIENVLSSYLQRDYSQKALVSEKGDALDALALSINLFGDEIGESFRVIEQQKSVLLSTMVSKEKLKQANKEINVLLKEVHHRVKNNLQIITSLIGLQLGRIDDPGLQSIFRELQNRISSMAIVHEMLYQSGDLSKVNYTKYIEALVKQLLGAYSLGGCRVNVNIEIEDIALNVNTSIPLGLLINEIITNSLKFAFKERKEGLISIGMKKAKNGFVLVVSDNGTGFDWDWVVSDKNSQSLGVKLINNLSKQLKGDLKVKVENGTKYILNFDEII